MKFYHSIRTASDHLPNSFSSFQVLNHPAASALANIKTRLGQAWSQRLGQHPELVRQALAEAEVLAAQTNYPHLLFPVLAEEKVHQVSRWHERQTALLNFPPHRDALAA